jgi:hypothetical protein
MKKLAGLAVPFLVVVLLLGWMLATPTFEINHLNLVPVADGGNPVALLYQTGTTVADGALPPPPPPFAQGNGVMVADGGPPAPPPPFMLSGITLADGGPPAPPPPFFLSSITLADGGPPAPPPPFAV